jgi:hypothetical protein
MVQAPAGFLRHQDTLGMIAAVVRPRTHTIVATFAHFLDFPIVVQRTRLGSGASGIKG